MQSPIFDSQSNLHLKNPIFVDKKNVLSKLESSTSKKLTLITGLSGSGKSFIMSNWLQKQNNKAVFVSVAENTKTLLSFIKNLATSIRPIDNQFYLEMKALFLENETKINTEFFLKLLIEFLSTQKSDLIFVFDDLQFIDNILILDILNTLISKTNDNIHFFLISRNEIILNCIDNLLLHNNAISITQDDLNFSDTEIQELFKIYDLTISLVQANMILEKTEGWFFPLQIIVFSIAEKYTTNKKRKNMISEQELKLFLESLPFEENIITQYLFAFLNKVHPNEKDFLFKTALLDKFNQDMINNLISDNLIDITELFYKKNLFLISLDNYQCWYRYHHIFSDFLRKFLKNNQLETYQKYQAQIAKWFKDHGFLEEALKHASLSNSEFLLNMIEDVGYNMISMDKHEELKQYIELLQPQIIDQNFLICAYYSWLNAEDFNLDFSEKLILNAQKNLLKKTPLENRTFNTSMIYYIKILIEIKRRNYHIVLKLAKKIVKNENELNRYFLGSAYSSLGFFNLQHGNHKKALLEFNKSVNFFKLTNNTLVYLRGMIFIGRTFLYMGSLKEAKKKYEETIQEYEKKHLLKHFDLFSVYTDLSIIACYQNQKKESKKYLTQADYFVSSSPSLIYYYSAQINVNISFRNLEEAEFFLIKAKELVITKGMNNHLNTLLSLENLLLIHQGKSHLVIKWMNEIENIVINKMNGLLECSMDDVVSIYADAYPLLLFYLTSNNYLNALNIIDWIYKVVEKLKIEPIMISLLVLKSIFLQKTDKSVSAQKTLKNALLIAEKQNYIGLFVNEFDSTVIKDVLVEILENDKSNIDIIFLKKILASFPTETNSKNEKSLSKKEVEIMEILKSNVTLNEIAIKFDFSINTLKTHLKRIYKKLGVKNRTDALARFSEGDNF